MITTFITFSVISILISLLFILFLIYLFKEILKRDKNRMDIKEIASYFETTENDMYKIFQKLKWIERKAKYWKVTEEGKNKKGIEAQNFKKGIAEPLWDIQIVHDKALVSTITIYKSLN